jgi:hypothetical protein
MKAAEIEALVEAMGPKPDNAAYHKAMRDVRDVVYKAEKYFGGPVKIVAVRQKSGGPGSLVTTLTISPAD